MLAAAAALGAVLRALDHRALSPGDCARLVGPLAVVEKAAAAAKASAAARAASTGVHRAAGFADAAEWLAHQSGTSTAGARAALQTIEDLEDLGHTSHALAAGDLSLDQAKEITATERERPGSEAEMLEVARRAGLATLQDHGRRRRAEGIGVEELHRRQQRARRVHTSRDGLGMVNIHASLPPEVGVPLVNRLDRLTDRLRREAKQAVRAAGADGRTHERREAYAADALAYLLVGGAGDLDGPAGSDASSGSLGRRTRAQEPSTADRPNEDERAARRGRAAQREAGRAVDLVIVADLTAWRRGHAHAGEACHVIGGGPIPVELARRLADDAFVKGVLHDGVAIHTVAHLGRYRRAELQTALDLGAPPDFEGVTCAEAGCERRYGLEWDHIVPLANRGPTSYDNLAPRCWPHHRAKTDADRRAGLLGPRPPSPPTDQAPGGAPRDPPP